MSTNPGPDPDGPGIFCALLRPFRARYAFPALSPAAGPRGPHFVRVYPCPIWINSRHAPVGDGGIFANSGPLF